MVECKQGGKIRSPLRPLITAYWKILDRRFHNCWRYLPFAIFMGRILEARDGEEREIDGIRRIPRSIELL